MEQEGPSLWQSRRTFWTSCCRGVIRVSCQQGWLIDELKKALSERILSAELDDHLETETAEGAVNRRNGSSKKTVLTGSSKVTLAVPRDRAGTFDPKLIAKYQRRCKRRSENPSVKKRPDWLAAPE